MAPTDLSQLRADLEAQAQEVTQDSQDWAAERARQDAYEEIRYRIGKLTNATAATASEWQDWPAEWYAAALTINRAERFKQLAESLYSDVDPFPGRKSPRINRLAGLLMNAGCDPDSGIDVTEVVKLAMIVRDPLGLVDHLFSLAQLLDQLVRAVGNHDFSFPSHWLRAPTSPALLATASAAGPSIKHDRDLAATKTTPITASPAPSLTQEDKATLILATLTSHHLPGTEYLNNTPIGLREISRLLQDGGQNVDPKSVTKFFQNEPEFGSHAAYCVACNTSRIEGKLRKLNGDIPDSWDNLGDNDTVDSSSESLFEAARRRLDGDED